jgi:phosphomannomutase
MKVSTLRASYPSYFMSKKKVQLTPELDVDGLLVGMADTYSEEKLTTIDGVKIDFANSWAHLRKSNTEPIIRIYTEAQSQEAADNLADRIIFEIKTIANI